MQSRAKLIKTKYLLVSKINEATKLELVYPLNRDSSQTT